MKALIYHRGDPDGWMSGFLLKKVYENSIYAHQMFGYNYEETGEPWMDNPEFDEFIFVDVTPPVSWLNKMEGDILEGRIKNILIYDHHHDRYEQISELDWIPSDVLNFVYSEESGAMIYYKHAIPMKMFTQYEDTLIAQVVQLISDYDTWAFDKMSNEDGKQTEILAFNQYLRGDAIGKYEPFIEFMERLISGDSSIDINDCIDDGRYLIDMEKRVNDNVIAKGEYLEKYDTFIYEGYPNWWFSKQVNKKLNLKDKPIKCWIGYRRKDEKGIMSFSVRTAEHAKTPAIEIAKLFGGGGHDAAGGFSIPLDEVEYKFFKPLDLDTIYGNL